MKKTAIVAVVAAAGLMAANSALACAGCGCSAPKKEAKAEDKHEIAKVSTDELKGIVAKEKGTILVDARSGKYDDGRRIANAKQLAPDASDKEIAKALPNKDAKIVAYCTNTGCPASAKLAHRLEHLGYKNVVKYPDGIEGWVADGNEVTK